MRAFFCGASVVAFCLLAFDVHAAEIEVIDDSGRAVLLKGPARRVISLSPHTTELIFAAGGGDKLVATTEGSNFPIQAQGLPKLGDQRAPDPTRIAAYKPDLIIGWLTSALDPLASLNVPVFTSTPTSLIEIADSIETFGVLLGTAGIAHARAEALRQKLDVLAKASAGKRIVRVLLQAGAEPESALTRENLLSDVITLCGGSNIITEDGINRAKPTIVQLTAMAPELVLIARTGAGAVPVVDSLGVTQWQTAGLPAARLGRVFMIDADTVFRSGPRLIEAAEPICELIEQTRK
jgi:iron complex transport system substrate-binding protein/vitamin B12 transport system substrate-binding protein